MRILLNPAPAEGGSGAAEAPAPAAATNPAPPAATAVTLPPAEYRALVEKAAIADAAEAEKARAAEEAEAARLAALAAKGEGETALRTQRESYDQKLAAEKARADAAEHQILTSTRSIAISEAVAGSAFVSVHAAAHARRELESRLESVRDPATGGVAVREKGTHRPAADAVKDWLASEEAAHFLKATTTGGTGSRGGSGASPTPTAADGKPAVPPQPKNLGEALIMRGRIARGLPPLPEADPTKVRPHGGFFPR